MSYVPLDDIEAEAAYEDAFWRKVEESEKWFENCPLRHENGNCLPHGGFCTSVNENVCEAMRQAYEQGRHDAIEEEFESLVKNNGNYQTIVC